MGGVIFAIVFSNAIVVLYRWLVNLAAKWLWHSIRNSQDLVCHSIRHFQRIPSTLDLRRSDELLCFRISMPLYELLNNLMYFPLNERSQNVLLLKCFLYGCSACLDNWWVRPLCRCLFAVVNLESPAPSATDLWLTMQHFLDLICKRKWFFDGLMHICNHIITSCV